MGIVVLLFLKQKLLVKFVTNFVSHVIFNKSNKTSEAMSAILILIATVAGEYIKLLSGEDSYMGISSYKSSKKMVVVDRAKATTFVKKAAPKRKDKVKLSFKDGAKERELFVSFDKHLKYKSAGDGAPFDILLYQRGEESGFAIKSKKGCVRVKNDEFKVGSCTGNDVALFVFVDNTSGERLDEIIRYDKNKRRITAPAGFSPPPLKWTRLIPSDFNKLLSKFDRSKCEKKCSTTGERAFVKLNKF